MTTKCGRCDRELGMLSSNRARPWVRDHEGKPRCAATAACNTARQLATKEER